MPNIFDTTDTENKAEKLLSLIDEYGKPFKVKELRKFYERKHQEAMDSNSASSYVYHLTKTKKIKKISRGLYAPLSYSGESNVSK